eukprot:TRINITY_DN1905_c0_g1_i1.p1 TRINITY_DN1905_c0_g1~~TRINITY_DN1905_c0_g1_i1.p1  ORF type:complete len:1684 (-),score=243.27 TRINITY_DN1905_c0_g1_i1:36-5021(-)
MDFSMLPWCNCAPTPSLAGSVLITNGIPAIDRHAVLQGFPQKPIHLTIENNSDSGEVGGILSRATNLARDGRFVMIDTSDPLGQTVHHLRSGLLARGVPANAAVVYSPLADIVSKSGVLPNLLHFAMMFAAAPRSAANIRLRHPRAVESLTQGDIAKLLSKAEAAVVRYVGGVDGRTSAAILSRFLAGVGLTSGKIGHTVDIIPRHSYDIVVPATGKLAGQRLFAAMVSRARASTAPALLPAAQPATELNSGFTPPLCAHCAQNPEASLPASLFAKGRARHTAESLVCGHCLSQLSTALRLGGTVMANPQLSPELQPSPQLVSDTFENGFLVTILPTGTPQGQFTVYLEVSAGSVNEEEGQLGLAHYVEHCVFSGTEKYPTETAVNAVLSRIGMSWATDTNAYTDYRKTVYQMTVPVGKSKIEDLSPKAPKGELDHLEVILDVLAEMVLHATFGDAKAMQNEQQAVLSEWHYRAGAVDDEYDTEINQLFGGKNDCPSCHRKPIGDIELISKWTPADLKKYYTKWYYPGNMCLYIVGDIDGKQALDIARRVFSSQQAKYAVEKPLRPLVAHTGQDYNSLIVPTTDPMSWGIPGFENGKITPCQSGWKLPDRQITGFAELQHAPKQPLCANDTSRTNRPPFITVADGSLSTFRASIQYPVPVTGISNELTQRLYFVDELIGWVIRYRSDLLRESASPAVEYVDWSVYPYLAFNAGICSFTVASRPGKWHEAIAAAVSEVRRLQEHGLAQADLDLAKRVVDGEVKAAAASEDSRDPEAVIEELILLKNTISVYQDRKTWLDSWKKVSPTITVEEVNNRLRHYFAPMAALSGEENSNFASLFCAIATYNECQEITLFDSPSGNGSADKPGDSGWVLGSNLAAFASSLPDAARSVTEATDHPHKEHREQPYQPRVRPGWGYEHTPWNTVATNPRLMKSLRAATNSGDRTHHVWQRLHVGENRLRAAFVEERAKPAPKYAPLPQPPEALLPEAELAALLGSGASEFKSKKTDSQIQATFAELPNGIRVQYKVTDFSDTVYLRMAFSGGSASTKSFQQNYSVAFAVATAAGVGQCSPAQLGLWLVFRQMDYSVGADEGTAAVTVTFPAAHGKKGIDEALQFLRVLFSKPKYDEAALHRTLISEMQYRERTDRTTDQACWSRLSDTLWQRDPRFCSPCVSDYATVTIDDVRAVLESCMHASNTEISCVGDVDPKVFEQSVLRAFGSVPASKDGQKPPAPNRVTSFISSDDLDGEGAGAAPQGEGLLNLLQLFGFGKNGRGKLGGAKGKASAPQGTNLKSECPNASETTEENSLIHGANCLLDGIDDDDDYQPLPDGEEDEAPQHAAPQVEGPVHHTSPLQTRGIVKTAAEPLAVPRRSRSTLLSPFTTSRHFPGRHCSNREFELDCRTARKARCLGATSCVGLRGTNTKELPKKAPSIADLTVAVEVTAYASTNQGHVYVVMPYPNGWGEMVTPSGEKVQDPTNGSACKAHPEEKWLSEELRSHPRYVMRCMSIFENIVNNRLYDILRREDGMVYSVSFRATKYDAFDSGFAYVYCNPFADELRLNFTIVEAVEVLQTALDNVTEDEFEAARDPLITAEQNNATSEDYWLLVLTGLSLPNNRKSPEMYHRKTEFMQALTLKDVLEVARKYFKPQKENLFLGIATTIAVD